MVTDNTAWSSLSTPAYCWYDNNPATYRETYGALYNWYTVNTGMLCPIGWHVPTDAEWEILTDYLGGESVAGGKLKEIGTTHWVSPNTGATNETGYTALPGGERSFNGNFDTVSGVGNWWGSSEIESIADYAHFQFMYSNGGGAYHGGKGYQGGLSVRCLRD